MVDSGYILKLETTGLAGSLHLHVRDRKQSRMTVRFWAECMEGWNCWPTEMEKASGRSVLGVHVC